MHEQWEEGSWAPEGAATEGVHAAMWQPSFAPCFSGGRFDRSAHLRANPDGTAHRPAQVIPYWRRRTPVKIPVQAPPGLVRLEGAAAQVVRAEARDLVFLGEENGKMLWSADISHWAQDRLDSLTGKAEPLGLREAGATLRGPETALLAFMHGMHGWHRTHGYCGSCGSRTAVCMSGHMRKCGAGNCNREIYPRLDPAVIVLVVHEPADGTPARCLLGSGVRAPEGGFSTLAGFVEHGESLEEAVAREVFEEAGIRVDQVTYRGSQPWPFPASLMLGFHARACSTDIRIDPQELRAARWFTAADLVQAGEWGQQGFPYCLPSSISIARALIDAWLDSLKAR